MRSCLCWGFRVLILNNLHPYPRHRSPLPPRWSYYIHPSAHATTSTPPRHPLPQGRVLAPWRHLSSPETIACGSGSRIEIGDAPTATPPPRHRAEHKIPYRQIYPLGFSRNSCRRGQHRGNTYTIAIGSAGR